MSLRRSAAGILAGGVAVISLSMASATPASAEVCANLVNVSGLGEASQDNNCPTSIGTP